jgi:hypothetical protein
LPRPECDDFLREACGSNESLRLNLVRMVDRHRRTGTFLKAARTGEDDPFTGTERFEPLALLGKGGFGSVYRVRDRQLGIEVALKLLHGTSPLLVRDFRGEPRSLEDVWHPHLINIYDLYCEPLEADGPPRWFYTMELIEGQPFPLALRPEVLRGLFRQLAEAVIALHSFDILHCDIKPSNVLVDGDGRLVLLDFGLARDSQKSAEKTPGGTPGYMAPEQASCGHLTPAADWYSVGVMLHHALTGELPHEEIAVAPVDPGFTDLFAFCLRLLEKDAGQRPGEEEIREIFSIPETGAVRRQPVQAPFGGRIRELAALHTALADVAGGKCVTASITGASGTGKSTLINQFLAKADGNPLILRGRCYEAETVPYKGIEEIATGASDYLMLLDNEAAGAIRPEDVSLLGRLFPSFRESIPERFRSDDPAVLRVRAFTAFVELLRRFGRERLLIVAVDDLQWGDTDTEAMVREMTAGSEPPRMLLLLASRNRVGLPADYRIELGDLDEESAFSLAKALLGPADRDGQGARALAAASRNPFQMEQFAIAGSLDFGEVIRERLRALPVEARRFAQTIAIAAAPTPVPVLKDAAGLGNEVLTCRRLLRAARLVRMTGPRAEDCEVWHDGIRAAIVADMPADERRESHGRLAIALEERGSDSEAIAVHFKDAGRSADAARHSVVAAEKASNALAFDRAARLFQMTLELSPDAPHRDQLLRKLGDALAFAGRGIAAAAAYTDAQKLAPESDSMTLRIRAAAELLRAGEIERGLKSLRELAHEVSLPFPGSNFPLLMRLGMERLYSRFQRFDEKPAAAGDEGAKARLDVCWAAAIGTGLVNPLYTAYFCALNLRLGVRSGDPERLALALAVEAPRHAYHDDGICAKTKALFKAAEATATGVSPQVLAMLEAQRGVACMLRGRVSESLYHSDRAIARFKGECRGVAWEIATARSFHLTAQAILGQWRRNADELPALLSDALERGDKYSFTNLQLCTSSYTSFLFRNKPEAGHEAIDAALAGWPHRRFDVQSLYALLGHMDVDLFDGRPRRALQRAEEQWRKAHWSGLLRLTLMRVYALATRARAAIAVAALDDTPATERRVLLARAVRDARKLERDKARYAPGLALLLRAGIQSVEGNVEDAMMSLAKAMPALDKAELVPWSSACRLRLAQQGHPDYVPASGRNPLTWFETEGITNSKGVCDMFVPGRWERIE